MRRRFWIEAALSAAGSALLATTLLWSDWIEAVFGVDPDHGNGAFEWVAALVAFVACSSWLARLERRRLLARTSER